MAIRLTDPPDADKPDTRQLTIWREQIFGMFNLSGTVTATPGLIAAGAIGTVTIPVTGCRANMSQSVVIGAPSALNAGLVWSGFISANDTVTVRIYNTTGGGITPASSQWTARVFV